MLCKICGMKIADNSTECSKCFPKTENISRLHLQDQTLNLVKPEYKEWKTIVMLIWALLLIGGGFASIVLSILAIKNGRTINNLWISGQYKLARSKAENVKKYTKWALIFNIIGLVYMIFMFPSMIHLFIKTFTTW